MGICIDRCLCFQQSFQALKTIAKQHQCQTIQALSAYVDFGKKCGLCQPYIEHMLISGETIFSEIITASTPSELQCEYEKITDKQHTGRYDTCRNSDPCDGDG